MGDSGHRKRKRPETGHEGSKTVKGIFKSNDLDNSSTSDWGLIIEENTRARSRHQPIRLVEEPLTLICYWDSCYVDFTEYPGFNEHLQQHITNYVSNEGTYGCYWVDCSYRANSLPDLTQHLCLHGYYSKLKSIGENVEKRMSLPECYADVIPIPNVSGGYQCEWEFCNNNFVTIYDFLVHVRLHIFHSSKGSKEAFINCAWKGCKSSKFTCQYKLSEHVRIHTKEKIIACPTCAHLFSTKTKFSDHRKRQLPIEMKNCTCSQCSKYFPSERLLRDHMRLHINHYKCSMCEMTCPKPSVLAKHIRYKHLNVRPFKCKDCKYRAVSRHNLEDHARRHSHEKKFPCDECDARYRTAYGRDKHYQTVHGKGWECLYECHNCKRRFSRGGLLTKHLMKHHDYHWPSGHSRFRYKQDADGFFRLQTVRYETLEVTEEIIKGKTVQVPSASNSLKYSLKMRSPTSHSDLPTFEVILEPEPTKQVFITIDDLDSKGNVLKTQTIQSSEIICDDMKEIEVTENKVVCFDGDKAGSSKETS